MNPKMLKLTHLSKLLATALLSTGLLITACSSDNDVNEISTSNTTDEVDTSNTAASELSAIDDNNSIDDSNSIDDAIAPETAVNKTTPDLVASDTVINPVLNYNEQPSLVTNPTEAGTPEDTVKRALDTLYYGEVIDAVNYYRVDIDNFEQELANTQSAFQQTVESVTITHTQYSVDRIRATITGELKLKGQSEPAPLTYQLRKVGKEWKILG